MTRQDTNKQRNGIITSGHSSGTTKHRARGIETLRARREEIIARQAIIQHDAFLRACNDTRLDAVMTRVFKNPPGVIDRTCCSCGKPMFYRHFQSNFASEKKKRKTDCLFSIPLSFDEIFGVEKESKEMWNDKLFEIPCCGCMGKITAGETVPIIVDGKITTMTLENETVRDGRTV